MPLNADGKMKGGFQPGVKHYNWKGGRMVDKKGIYILVHGRGYVREHRLVMEKYLGRQLVPGERVYHINGNNNDNRLENLKLSYTKDATVINTIVKGVSPRRKNWTSLAHVILPKYMVGKSVVIKLMDGGGEEYTTTARMTGNTAHVYVHQSWIDKPVEVRLSS
jgi:hypothetical protein